MKVVVLEGGDGGVETFDFIPDGGVCRFGSGGACCFSTEIHSLSSSPSNMVSIARFLDRICDDPDSSVSAEGDLMGDSVAL